MQIYKKPVVTAIGRWVFNDHPSYAIPPDGDNMTRGLAFAAKGCYNSWGVDRRSCVANQKAVLAHQHESVLEHGTITFFVEGISRALSLEMNRHRHFNISQSSTRYVDVSDGSIVLDPYYAELYERDRRDGLGEEEALLLDGFLRSAREAISAYGEQVDILMFLNPNQLEGFELRKWARGKARALLPHCLETKVTYTGNLRGWRHFLLLRSGLGAEPEIRRLTYFIHQKLLEIAPLYFDFNEDYSAGKYPVYTVKENYEDL